MDYWQTGMTDLFSSTYCYLVNSLCCLLYRKEYLRYTKVQDIEKVQKEVLMRILKKNESCGFGIQHGFADIQNAREYQDRVPLTVYEDYANDMELLQEYGVNNLFSEPILLLEITSGSTSSSKLIPYNQSLKEEFQMGLKPWIYNLYSSFKGVKWGKSYWSITPAATEKRYTKSGISIGFEEDSAYFGRLERKLQNSIFAVPSSVGRIQDMDAFYFETSYHLLLCKNLTIISIWNPTYLLLLLDYMEQYRDKLVDKISIKDKSRGTYIQRVLKNKEYNLLWKRLKVISCWCDANAAPYAEKLKQLFPGVSIQPKGLLATEGFISFPLAGEEGARPSVTSHFFEFRDMEDGALCLAHELRKGRSYEVIITTSGGLYRYQLKDIVQVTGFSGVFPLLKFQGKADKVSDLFGEKLHEGFVKSVLDRLNFKPEFCMIAPEKDHYVLYIKSDREVPSGIEDALRENFHYDYCRKLGQLKDLRIFQLTGNPEQEYLEACMARGQRLGDIKPVLLYPFSGLDKTFKGRYL
jgi:hypothetical protein